MIQTVSMYVFTVSVEQFGKLINLSLSLYYFVVVVVIFIGSLGHQYKTVHTKTMQSI